MTPLTKLQRYTAYCIMREEAERPMMDSDGTPINIVGLCWMACELLDECYMSFREITLSEYFPEITARKPEDAGFFWFPPGDWTERIKILDACIESTHP